MPELREEVKKLQVEKADSRARGVSQVWQAKGLGGANFGCVANKGVASEILEVWQGKELRKGEDRKLKLENSGEGARVEMESGRGARGSTPRAV